jgi:membrane associated rhomboid family serine protease
VTESKLKTPKGIAMLPATWILGALSVVLFALQVVDAVGLSTAFQGAVIRGMPISNLMRFGAINTDTAWSEPWRLLAACYVHMGFLHLGLNILALSVLGKQNEERIGSGLFAVSYVVTGAFGFLVSNIWYGRALFITAGASGAVFGLIGVVIGERARRNDPTWKGTLFRSLVASFVYYFALDTNQAAHLGGLGLGLAIGYFVAHKPIRRPASVRLAAVAGVALSLVCLTVPHFSPKWRALRQLEHGAGAMELRAEAVRYTNNGRGALLSASKSIGNAEQVKGLQQAAAQYKLAGPSWSRYLRQSKESPDRYESRYWLAEAHRNGVRIQLALHQMKPEEHRAPSAAEIAEAKAVAMDARDVDGDTEFLDNAAIFVVDISDVERDLAYQTFDDTKGAKGVEKRAKVRVDVVAGKKTVRVEAIPPVVLQCVKAREEYVRRVPTKLDTEKHTLEYRVYAGDTYLNYGQFDRARAHFEPMYKDECGKTKFGSLAWEKLIEMCTIEGDIARARLLTDEGKARSCAVDD